MGLLSDVPLFVGLPTLTDFGVRSLHCCGSHGLRSSSYFALAVCSSTCSASWVHTDPVRWACNPRAPLQGCAAAMRGCPSQAIHASTHRSSHVALHLRLCFVALESRQTKAHPAKTVQSSKMAIPQICYGKTSRQKTQAIPWSVFLAHTSQHSDRGGCTKG